MTAGFFAGIALALIPQTWIPLAAAGALAAILSIRWGHSLLWTVLGLGRGAPKAILVSAPEGYFSPKVLGARPLPPRITGLGGAVEIPLK